MKVPMPRSGYCEEAFYGMTKDGITLLAIGFTGAKSPQFKLP